MSMSRDKIGIAVGAAILGGGIAVILAFAESPLSEWVGIPATAFLVIAVAATSLALCWQWLERRGRRAPVDDSFSDPGVSVEVDCRACGQFNRVPSHRLRDRPKCGRCKVRLMPGKRVVLCRVRPMEGVLRRGLDALWTDEDQLWQLLADHVAIENKARAEAVDPSARVVN